MLLPNDRISFIKQILSGISERYDIKFDAIGTDGNHMHLFVNAPPKYSPSEIIRITKSITARRIVAKFQEIKEDLWGGEFWSDGYYVATVSERGNWQIVERYVKNQGKKPEDVQLRLL